MNWSLLLKLSAFGGVMAFATINFIPFEFEFVVWLFVYGFCAYAISKSCQDRFFTHGFLLGIINCIFYSAFHLAFFESYTSAHTLLMSQVNTIVPAPANQRPIVLAIGVVMCILGALLQGLICHFVSKKMQKPVAV